MRRLGHILLFFVLFLAILFAVDSVFSLYYASTSYSWKPTTGRVLQSQESDSGYNSQPSLLFVYSYNVNGTTYKSMNLYPEGPFLFSSSIEKMLVNGTYYANTYPVGSSITVYYNPSKPSISAVNRGYSEIHLANIIFIVFTFFSTGISFFLFDKNPRHLGFTRKSERYIVTLLDNLGLLLVSFGFLATFLFFYVILLVIINSILLHGFTAMVNSLMSFFHSFSFPTEPFLVLLYVSFALILALLCLLVVKGLNSFWIKTHTKYYYTTSNNRAEFDPESNKWTLYVEGYYKKDGMQKHFFHMVNKKFRSEQAAMKFFNRRIHEKEYLREANVNKINDENEYWSFSKPKLGIFKKYLFSFSDTDQKQEETKEKLVFKYQIYSNVLLFFIPILFIAFDYGLVFIVEFINLMNNPGVAYLSYDSFVSSLNIILNDVPFVTFMIIILLIEFVYLLINSVVALKWYIVNVYKKALIKKKTQNEESAKESSI